MCQQTQRVSSLDDREHLELAVLPDQVGDGGMAGLVGGDPPALVLRVLDRLLEADLLGELGLLHVGPVEGGRSAPKRPHEGLVEQVLDHHG